MKTSKTKQISIQLEITYIKILVCIVIKIIQEF